MILSTEKYKAKCTKKYKAKYTLKEHNTQHSGHTDFFQNELMVEIYSKSIVRAIGKVLCTIFS